MSIRYALGSATWSHGRCALPGRLLDLIGGNAGAIPALLVMGRAPGRRKCLELATALGEELLRKAERREAGWVWDALEADWEEAVGWRYHDWGATLHVGEAEGDLQSVVEDQFVQRGVSGLLLEGRDFLFDLLE